MNIITKQSIPKSKFAKKCFNIYLSSNFKFISHTKITSKIRIINKQMNLFKLISYQDKLFVNKAVV